MIWKKLEIYLKVLKFSFYSENKKQQILNETLKEEIMRAHKSFNVCFNNAIKHSELIEWTFWMQISTINNKE